jgi:hypothetical protein
MWKSAPNACSISTLNGKGNPLIWILIFVVAATSYPVSFLFSFRKKKLLLLTIYTIKEFIHMADFGSHGTLSKSYSYNDLDLDNCRGAYRKLLYKCMNLIHSQKY